MVSKQNQFRALILALLLGVLGLGKALLPGRSLLPQDVRSFSPFRETLDPAERSALDREAVPQRLDKLFQFLPFDTAVGQAYRGGRLPLWEPRILCGLPLVSQTTSRAFYPSSLLFALAPPATLYAWIYLLHLVLGGVLAFRLARFMGISLGGSYFALASFELSGFAFAHLHHPMIFYSAVWILPVLEITGRILRHGAPPRLRLQLSLALAACTALSWLAGFSQASLLLCYIAFFSTLWVFVLEALVRKPQRFEPSRFVLVGAGLLIGILLASVQILPSIEAARESSRGPAPLSLLRQVALAPVHLLEYFLPGLLAPERDIIPLPAKVRPSFFALLLLPLSKAKALNSGALNHTELAMSVGLWPLLLALSTLGRRFPRGPAIRRLWTMALIGILGAMTAPGIAQALHILPGLNVGDFKRLLILPALALPLLAGFGFDQFKGESRLPAYAGLVLLASGGALLLAGQERFIQWFAWAFDQRFGSGAGAQFQAALLPGEAAANLSLLVRILLLAGGSLLLPTLLRKQRLSLMLCLVAALALERLPHLWRLSPAPPASSLQAALPLFPPSARDTHSWTPPRRLLRLEPSGGEARPPQDVRLLPPNLPLLYGLSDTMGYAPIPSRRVREFFETLEPGCSTQGAGLGCLRKESSLDQPLFQVLSPHYILTTADLSARKDWKLLASTGPPRLYENRAPRPLVEILPPNPKAKVRVLSYAPGDILVETQLPENAPPSKLFLREAWAPGWTFEIQGKQTKRGITQPEQILFQSIQLPSGTRRIRLLYAPPSFLLGELLSLLGLMLALMAWLLSRF
ncbi:MAG TPA: hypothetical protein ENK02_16110 [Planctomycetes bacterium]|nr:hypothetical protein [Planctomycetota bacterium]